MSDIEPLREYRDATYEKIDVYGYITFYPCLILGIVGVWLKILVWDRRVNDYVELVVEPSHVSFDTPTHKTELLMLIDPVADFVNSIFDELNIARPTTK